MRSAIAMDDDEAILLEEEAEAIELAEYKRGLVLAGVPPKDVWEYCPWCGKYSYVFGVVSSWNCESCGYYPSADLFGGQYS